MRFGQREFAALEMPEAQRVVAARIQRVAAQGLAPIERRTARGMAVLVEVQAGEEEFVGAGDIGGRGRFGGGRRDFGFERAALADRR